MPFLTVGRDIVVVYEAPLVEILTSCMKHLLTIGRDVAVMYAAGEAERAKAGEHVGGQDDLDELYGGDAMEAAGEAAAAAGDSSDIEAEVSASSQTQLF